MTYTFEMLCTMVIEDLKLRGFLPTTIEFNFNDEKVYFFIANNKEGSRNFIISLEDNKIMINGLEEEVNGEKLKKLKIMTKEEILNFTINREDNECCCIN